MRKPSPRDPEAPGSPADDPPTAPAPGQAGCEVDPATLTAPGCEVLFEDTALERDPLPLWGAIDCQQASRHRLVAQGDPHPTSSGAAQPDTSARQLTVFDGDDFWGERCELGENSRRSTPMPTYAEGARRITFISFRLPDSFPLAASSWQSVMQMKQIQPAANGGGTPVLSLEANRWLWSLWQSDSPGPSETNHQLWSAPAVPGIWTRFAFDVTYSHDPGTGAIKIYGDLNGDGDALDLNEQSPSLSTYTLKTETAGGSADDGVPAGAAIASHLRVGIYHAPIVSCPLTSGGCSSQIDNVEIAGAGR